jgi:hypothetical protein
MMLLRFRAALPFFLNPALLLVVAATEPGAADDEAAAAADPKEEEKEKESCCRPWGSGGEPATVQAGEAAAA